MIESDHDPLPYGSRPGFQRLPSRGGQDEYAGGHDSVYLVVFDSSPDSLLWCWASNRYNLRAGPSEILMRISHAQCEHESTPKARAKCRRQRNGGEGKATPKVVNFSTTGRGKDPDDNYGQTPRFKEDECMVCGVEEIQFRGTD